MEPSILQKKAEILLERDVYPLLKNFPQAEKFSLSQEIKQSCFRLIRAAVMANNLTVVKKRLEWLDEADAENTEEQNTPTEAPVAPRVADVTAPAGTDTPHEDNAV